MKKKFSFLALCMIWALVSNVQAQFVPTAGTYYNIVQNNATTLGIDASSTYAQVKTLVAGTTAQAFQFIPVSGVANTYYIQSAAGLYMIDQSDGYDVKWNATNPATAYSQWILTGTTASTIEFSSVNKGSTYFLSAQSAPPTSGKQMYADCTTSKTYAASFVFTLTPLTTATINYQDLSGTTIRASRIQLTGLTDGTPYTLPTTDTNGFTSTINLLTYGASTSTATFTPVAGTNTTITLQFPSVPGIGITVTSFDFTGPLTRTFSVTTANLTGSTTLTSSDPNVTLSPSTISTNGTTIVTATAAAATAASGTITVYDATDAITKTISYSMNPLANWYYTIVQQNGGLLMGGAPTAGTSVTLAAATGSTNQLFKFNQVSDTTYNIQNYTGTYLTWYTNAGSYVASIDAANPTRTQFKLVGNSATGIKLRLGDGSANYFSTDAAIVGSSFWHNIGYAANAALNLVRAPSSFTGVTPSSLAFTSALNVKTFIVSGYNFTDVVNLTAPTGITFSLNGTPVTSIPAATANAGPVTVTATYDQVTVLTSGNITISSTGCTTQTLPITVASSALLVSPSNLAFTTFANSQTFTVSGSQLTADVSFTAPSGISLNPSTIPFATANAGAVTVTATYDGVTPITSDNITVSSSGATSQTIAVTGTVIFIPTANVYYNIEEVDRTLYVDSAATAQPVTVAQVAGSPTQAFKFIAVPSTTGTYYIQNAHGSYLSKVSSSGWSVDYEATTNGTNSEWIMTGSVNTAIKLQSVAIGGTGNYLDSQNGTNLYDNNASGRAQGQFTMTPLTTVIIKYQDESGNAIKADSIVVSTGLTVGGNYQVPASDAANFTANGVNYVYDVTSINNVTVVAGNTNIVLKYTLPVISVSTGGINGFNYDLSIGSGPSAEQSFTVAGSLLTNDVTVTAPADYEVSLTSGTYDVLPLVLSSTGTLASTTVYVRLKSGLVMASYNESVSISSPGAANQTVALAGTVTDTATGINQPINSIGITAVNGKIEFTAAAGETVQIYNAIGRKLVNKLSVEGVNTIAVTAHGVVMVKVGTRVAKLVL